MAARYPPAGFPLIIAVRPVKAASGVGGRGLVRSPSARALGMRLPARGSSRHGPLGSVCSIRRPGSRPSSCWSSSRGFRIIASDNRSSSAPESGALLALTTSSSPMRGASPGLTGHQLRPAEPRPGPGRRDRARPWSAVVRGRRGLDCVRHRPPQAGRTGCRRLRGRPGRRSHGFVTAKSLARAGRYGRG